MRAKSSSEGKKQATRRGSGAVGRKLVHELEAAAGGAAAGAVAGVLAGPPGAIAGAVIGAAAGAMAECAVESEGAIARAKDAQLDDEIGVTAGDIGAPKLKHPPAKVGAFSAAALGLSGGGSYATAEGPMSSSDD
jgi:hypothetical protein